MISSDTIITGVKCNKCKVTLPPHTIQQHLDQTFMDKFHNCHSMKCSYCNTDMLICLNAEDACESCLYSGAVELEHIEMYMKKNFITKKMKNEILDMINTIKKRQKKSFEEFYKESVRLVVEAQEEE